MAAVVLREFAEPSGMSPGSSPHFWRRFFFARSRRILGYRQIRNLWMIAGFSGFRPPPKSRIAGMRSRTARPRMKARRTYRSRLQSRLFFKQSLVLVPPRRISVMTLCRRYPCNGWPCCQTSSLTFCTVTGTSTDSLPLTMVSFEFSTLSRYSPAFNCLPFTVEGWEQGDAIALGARHSEPEDGECQYESLQHERSPGTGRFLLFFGPGEPIKEFSTTLSWMLVTARLFLQRSGRRGKEIREREFDAETRRRGERRGEKMEGRAFWIRWKFGAADSTWALSAETAERSGWVCGEKGKATLTGRGGRLLVH